MIITDKQYIALVNKGVINGCGGKKGFSFSHLARKLSELDYFDQEKFKSLQNDIERNGCGPHDVDYAIGGKCYNKIIADIRLCNYIFKKLHWCNIALRIFIYIMIFLGLYKYGGKYFCYGAKKTLDDLL